MTEEAARNVEDDGGRSEVRVERLIVKRRTWASDGRSGILLMVDEQTMVEMREVRP